MPKKLSEEKKKEMVELFKKGEDLKDLSILYSFKESTIIKHLKNLMDDYDDVKRELLKNNPKKKNLLKVNTNKKVGVKDSVEELRITELDIKYEPNVEIYNNRHYGNENFHEILPLEEFTDFDTRKDLTSELLKETSLPKNIYMIVNNNIELEIKKLNDFPEYSFLPKDDQDRKVIKLFSDKKSANLFCDKSQRVIKIPDGRIFKLVSPILLQKGITRILFDNSLLSF